MPQEKTTIARPYAEAVFARAQESDSLDRWTDMLSLLETVVSTPEMTGLIDHPKLSRDQLRDLVLEIVADGLDEEGRNLVKLLVRNDRLTLAPEIAALFEKLKRERQGRLHVHVQSAYALNAAQKKELAEVLKERLGREVEISAEKQPDLIGGVLIRAGDLVIDGSVRGQLQKLANELRI